MKMNTNTDEHMKNERENVIKNILVVSLLELIPIKRILNILLISVKYMITLHDYNLIRW